MIDRVNRIGRVFLIGAGPGDPKLLTLRGAEALAASDVIIYDSLINRDTLVHAKRGAELVYAGKRAGNQSLSQVEINRLMVERAQAGFTVARLKGGDPFIFGRGGEEAEALSEAGIPWEVVPGVSAGTAAAAYAGIPLTHRLYSSGVSFLTGHHSDSTPNPVDWSAAARGPDTLVVFMCATTISAISRKLIAYGKPANTPVALIRWGTYEHQQVVTSSLADVAESPELGEAWRESGSPVIAVIGEVVDLSRRLHWFGQPASQLPAQAAVEI